MPNDTIDPTSPAYDAPEKPPLTHKELSWHVTVAGIRAQKKAEAAGCQPEARHALALAAAAEGGVPLEFPVITLATLWAMEASEPFVVDVADTNGGDKALLALTLLQPERVMLSSLGGDVEDLRMGMLEVSAILTADYYVRLRRNYEGQMAALKALTGGVDQADYEGKSLGESKPSNVNVDPPAAGS